MLEGTKKTIYLSTCTFKRLTYNPHRHHEQSFTSNRNRSLSMFLLKEMITRVRSFCIFGVKGKWRKSKILTHCLLQKHRWHPCMPQQCVCYACKKQYTVFYRWIQNLLLKMEKNVYLAPTNSSHGGSLLQRWTVSKGPKLSVKYSTLSEQLWSKSTLGATLDLQDMAPGNHDIQFTSSKVLSSRKKINLFVNCRTVWAVLGSSEPCCPKDYYDCLQSYLQYD